MPKTIVLCTVGTSLLSNIGRESDPQLKEAYEKKDSKKLAVALNEYDQSERLCGAEINSIASMVDKGYVTEDCSIHFLVSNTDDGIFLGKTFVEYFKNLRRHTAVTSIIVSDLQDSDPKTFRTKGLRNLAREIGKIVREYSVEPCVINATGGYKAQIAIAVLFGQALKIPVYYKHEKFNEIIAFPPMPIAFDYEFWDQLKKRHNDVLSILSEPNDVAYKNDLLEGMRAEDSERLETLLEHVYDEERKDYMISLSPVGQVFYESFLNRFPDILDQELPPPVPTSKKRESKWEDSGHMQRYPEVMRFMERVTNEVPQVVYCRTDYFNQDLSRITRFRLRSEVIEGIYSNGTWTAKFVVETSAKTEGQKNAVIALLNQWLKEDYR